MTGFRGRPDRYRVKVASEETFDVVVSGTPRAPVLNVHGELDFATAIVLTRAVNEIMDRGVPTLALDLTGVSFIDSSGMSALVRANLRSQALGTRLTIRGAMGNARRAIDACGLGSLVI
jgi:anti-sigma B factor antagonist